MRPHILISLMALAVAAQVCACCATFGAPQSPTPTAPASEAEQRLRERWREAVEGSPDGSFTVTVTDEEVTALVPQILAEREELPPISDPQVRFRDGYIEVSATITVAGSVPLPGQATFSAAVVDGRIDVTLEEAAFGPLSIPESALTELTGTLDEALSERILAETNGATITSVQIGEGQMTISGQVPSR